MHEKRLRVCHKNVFLIKHPIVLLEAVKKMVSTTPLRQNVIGILEGRGLLST